MVLEIWTHAWLALLPLCLCEIVHCGEVCVVKQRCLFHGRSSKREEEEIPCLGRAYLQWPEDLILDPFLKVCHLAIGPSWGSSWYSMSLEIYLRSKPQQYLTRCLLFYFNVFTSVKLGHYLSERVLLISHALIYPLHAGKEKVSSLLKANYL